MTSTPLRKSVLFSLLLIGILILFACSTASKKGENASDSGIIYGPGFAFTLTAPPGWRLDENAAQENDLFAAVLPDHKSWKRAKVRMYASIVRLDTTKHETIQTVMKRDAKYFKTRSNSLQITDLDTLSQGEQTIYLRTIIGVENEPYKIIGYADEGNLIVLIGMGTTKKSLFDENINNFRSLLGSFRFFEKQTKFVAPE